MPRASLSDPTILFLRTVWALDHGLQSHSKRMRARIGVTGPQRIVLRTLFLAPGTSPSELAGVLVLHKSTVSVILDALEKADLLRRTPSQLDRRAVVLRLTAKGRRVAGQQAGTVEAVFRKALSRMPARDVRVARRVLEALTRALV